MLIAILFFVSKMFDLFTTNLLLRHGFRESNFIYNKYGETTCFILVYISTFIIYGLQKLFKIYELRFMEEILIILIAISIIVPVYNLALVFLIN